MIAGGAVRRPDAHRASGAAVLAAVLASIIAAPAPTAAQGSLGTQGFGYPTGQLSTHAAAAGGALAEVDHTTPLNPAALATWGRAGGYIQYEPEFRSVSVPGGGDRTTTIRFPVVAAAVPWGPRAVVGISASTFLDRTWGTVVTGRQSFSGDTVTFTDRFRTAGAITDLRLAASYALTPYLAVGFGGHALTGINRVTTSRVFPDTSNLSPLNETADLNYAGVAVSAGAQVRTRYVGAGISARRGGPIRLREGDSLVSRASVPDRVGAGVYVSAIPGVTLAANAERTSWSRLDGLGSARARGVDGWDIGAGAEAAGPRIGATQIGLRAGIRYRTLPFRAAGATVTERAVSAGIGVPLAGGRAAFDGSIARAFRAAMAGDVGERAWILSLGLAVRP